VSPDLDQFLLGEPEILIFKNVFCQSDFHLGICPKIKERAEN
jgi:hypothetical protein